jgi:hypothetical protein
MASSQLTYVSGFLAIRSNLALAAISLASLAEVGSMYVDENDVLTTVSFPLLSVVGTHLDIHNDVALTLAHLPKLTYIGGYIFFCQNNAAFVIPDGPPNAPLGGLEVIEANKGKTICRLQQGAGVCTNVPCP